MVLSQCIVAIILYINYISQTTAVLAATSKRSGAEVGREAVPLLLFLFGALGR